MTLIETMLSQEVVQRLGWTLVHYVWQGGLMVALLALVLWLARRRSACIRRVLSLPGEQRGKSPSWMAGLVVLVAFVAVTAALFVRAEQQDSSPPTEQEPSVQSSLQDSQPGQKSAVREFWEGLDALEAERRDLEARRWDGLSVIEQARRVHGAVDGGAQPLPQGTPKREPPKFSEQEARKFLAETRQRLGPSWDETFDRAKWSLVSGEEHKAFGDRRRELWSQAAALGEAAVGPLIGEIVRKGPHSPDATEALRLLGKPAVTALLDALPKAKDEWTRARLLDLVAWAKDPRARPTLQRALDDPLWSTRRTALHGLERLGAAPQDVYLHFLEEERDLLRQDAIAGLAKVGDEKAIPALLDVARNDMAQGKLGLGGYYLRREAVEALKQISERTGQSVELPAEEDTPSGKPGIGEASDRKDLEESAASERPAHSH